jgi:hypothetical protein
LEQLEIPSTFKRLGTALNIAIKSSGAESMRSVLEVAAAARLQMSVGDMDGLDSKLMQSLDKVEKEIGGPLMRGDKKGLALFAKELDVSISPYPPSVALPYSPQHPSSIVRYQHSQCPAASCVYPAATHPLSLPLPL